MPELVEKEADTEDESCSDGSAQATNDDGSCLGIWPACVAFLFNFLSFFMAVPYISQVFMHSPYALGLTDAAIKPDFDHVMIRTQRALAIYHSVNALAELVSSGPLGVLCDRIGVKPVGFISLVGQFVNVLTLTLCSARSGSGSPQIKKVLASMVLANGFAGICGSFKIASLAYVGRISTPASRNRNFALMGAVIGVSVCLGPLLGILVHKWTGETRPVLWLATALSLASLVVVVCFWPGRKLLPLPDHPAQWTEALPCFLFRNTLCSSGSLMIYGVMNFVDNFGLNMLHSGYAVFVRKQYHWSTDKLAFFLVMNGALQPLFQRTLLPALVRCRDEFLVLKVGYTSAMVSFLLTWLVGLQPQGNWMYTTSIFTGIGYIANPILLSLASRELPKSEMGRLFAAFASIETLSKVIAPVGAEFVMNRTLAGPMPSAVFLGAACIIAPAVVLAFFVKGTVKPASKGDTGEMQSDSSSSDSSCED